MPAFYGKTTTAAIAAAIGFEPSAPLEKFKTLSND
jgi:hypothetical protein